MPDPIDYPWAVVTIKDGVLMAAWHYRNPDVAHAGAKDWIALGYDEAHVVPLPDLLAWVRASAREGRT